MTSADVVINLPRNLIDWVRKNTPRVGPDDPFVFGRGKVTLDGPEKYEASNGVHLPQPRGWTLKNMLETTGLVERTVLVLWLLGIWNHHLISFWLVSNICLFFFFGDWIVNIVNIYGNLRPYWHWGEVAFLGAPLDSHENTSSSGLFSVARFFQSKMNPLRENPRYTIAYRANILGKNL